MTSPESIAPSPNIRGPHPRPVVLVTRRLPEAVEARLTHSYHARLNPDDQPLAPDRLTAVAAEVGAEALLVCPTDRVDARVIEDLPGSVRILATFSVGYDHIDLAAVRRRSLVVTNTPDVVTEATAEITLLLMLGAARRAAEGERLMRAAPGSAAAWTGWAPTQLLGMQLTGRRLAILGMGRIGQAVARRARAFGMHIHYHNRTRLPSDTEDGAVYHADPDSLLTVADVLSLHCPATPDMQRWLDRTRINRLPRPCLVVNTARGSLIDDKALIDALASQRITAAGLDVYAGEPNIEPRYRELPNTFLLPHLGTATLDTRTAMGMRALDNLDAFFAGHRPPDRVA